ncbi:MAG: Chorismate mutase type [Alphaproteobacteria bacterium]|nr:Chorismate mutase type [Alphaproteobacteria bacterium]
MGGQKGKPMKMLEKLRAEQDKIDAEITAAIARRIALRKKISAFRINENLPTIDEARMTQVLDQAEKNADGTGIPKEMAREVFSLLIDWSHRLDRHWRSNPKELATGGPVDPTIERE